MGISITVDRDNFASAVIEESYQQPILIDFFATWCGPCQMLKPMLEKLVKEYDFVLALVDIDQNPELASTYGVEGVPDVRVAIRGEILPGFVGMLQEFQLRQLLDKLGLRSTIDRDLEAAQVLSTAGELREAKAKFDQLFEQYPNHPTVTIAAAQLLLRLNQSEDALKMLATVDYNDREAYIKAQALKGLIDLHDTAHDSLNGDELDQQFTHGATLSLAENYEQALETFLAIVTQDRDYRNDGARKAMVTIFDFLGDDHLLTRTYRKRLTQALY